MSEYVHIVNNLEIIYTKLIDLCGKSNILGTEDCNSLLEEFSDCLNLLQDPNISSDLDINKIKPVSSIDKMGLANEVISLYEGGTDSKGISGYLASAFAVSIKPREVESWIEEYKNKPVTRSSKHGSVFDMTSQLQNMFEDMQTYISTIDMLDRSDFRGKSSKEEVILSYMSEKRQLIKDATNLMDIAKRMQDTLAFKKIIVEEINRESPSTAQRIISRMRDAKIAFSMLE